jgi:hypothetical protein
MSRTQDEILQRITAVADDDFLGWRRQVLIEALDYEHARGYLPDTTADQWAGLRTADVEQAAREYLTFAIGKIVDHRGISASRSVDKLTEMAWLLGRDDVVAAMDAADYPQYGAPKVRAFAEGMGWPWPGDVGERDAAALARMVDGLPCEPDCGEGCGL